MMYVRIFILLYCILYDKNCLASTYYIVSHLLNQSHQYLHHLDSSTDPSHQAILHDHIRHRHHHHSLYFQILTGKWNYW